MTKTYTYDYTNMMNAASVNSLTEARLSGTNDPYTEAENGNTTTDDTYVYNGDGQRVKKVEAGITTKYYYTGSVILYTADEDNNKLTGNISTPSGEIIASRDFNLGGNGADYYFFHYDIRGSVTSVLKPDGTLEQGYSYDEFGDTEKANNSSTFNNQMSYTGAISDTTTGLSYMNARYYNPATGSFTSQDTYYGNAYLPKTQHLYSYTGGNPVNYIDPTGHFWKELFTSIVQTIESWAPAYAVAGGVAMLDTPVPGPADIVGAVIAAVVTVGAVIYGGYKALSKADTYDKAVPYSASKAEVTTDDPNDTIIYREGSKTNYNMTPRLYNSKGEPTDYNGISFSLTKPSGKYSMTTVNTINKSGVLVAVIDGPDHCSVRPAPLLELKPGFTLLDWRKSKVNANTNPHFYTIVLQGLTIGK